jgi:para-aminobenzoate synthetase/4-amino-4-deoxychorismate lyase
VRVRFDDLTTRPATAWCLEDPLTVLRADRVDEVVPVLEAAEAAWRAGRWVAGVVGYEAAPALDPALPTHGPDPAGPPLVQLGVYEGPRPAPPLVAVDPPRHRLTVDRPVPVVEFAAAVDGIRAAIAAGDVYQVNHTERVLGRLDGDPADLYAAMALGQRGRHHALVDLGRHVLASASPELLLDWDGERLESRPMKGTARRRPRPDEDAAAAAALAASPKDRAENVMIVDLVRNDLGRVAVPGTVTVPRLWEVERFETVWQLTSTVTCRTRPGVGLVDVFRALFPAGSITGAPKRAAMARIRGAEATPRGPYCGAIGWLAPWPTPRARFSVAIRTAVVDAAGAVTYGVGGGITWGSDPRSEAAEAEDKARVLTTVRPPFRLLETLRLDAGGVRHAARHVARLAASAAWFGFALDAGDVARRLAALVPAPAPARVRLLADRDGGVEIEVVPLAGGPTRPGPAAVTLAVDHQVVRSDDPFCLHKTTNRAHYDAARARHPHADDVVLVNERGEAVETTIANLLFRRHGRWWTPPLSSGGLAGIGREVLVESGEVVEAVLLATDLPACDALEVVNDLRGRRPARLL